MKKTIIFTILAGFISYANAQWQQLNNTPSPAGYYCLASNGYDLFVGTIGVSMTPNNGVSWLAINNGLPYFGGSFSYPIVASIAISGSNIYAGTAYINASGIFLSVNNGANWTAVNNGLPSNCTVSSIAVSGSNIFAAIYNNGMYLSSNNGASWTAVNNGLPSNCSINSIVLSGSNIFVGTNNSGIFLSNNNGASWTAVNNGLPSNSYISSMVISGSNIFAGIGNYSNPIGIYLSSNNGASWTAVNNGLPSNSYISSMVASGSNIFARTTNSIFLSVNNGASWTPVNTGLPSWGVWGDENVAICGSNLYTIVDTSQIWKRPLSEMITTGCNEYFISSPTIYPNPIIDNLYLEFNLAKQNMIEVSILNITGQEIKKFDYSLSEGKNTLTMDMSELNSGIYFARIIADKGYSTNIKFIK